MSNLEEESFQYQIHDYDTDEVKFTGTSAQCGFFLGRRGNEIYRKSDKKVGPPHRKRRSSVKDRKDNKFYITKSKSPTSK